jgi:hypothetical protein
MAYTSSCPLCDLQIPRGTDHPSGGTILTCSTCGRFAIEDFLVANGTVSERQGKGYLLSALTKANKGRGLNIVMIDRAILRRLQEGQFAEPSISTKLETVVRWVEAEAKEFGDLVTTDPVRDYPIATCRSADEWKRLWLTAVEMGLLYAPHVAGANLEKLQVSLTYKGVEWLTARPNALSSKGFHW